MSFSNYYIHVVCTLSILDNNIVNEKGREKRSERRTVDQQYLVPFNLYAKQPGGTYVVADNINNWGFLTCRLGG